MRENSHADGIRATDEKSVLANLGGIQNCGGYNTESERSGAWPSDAAHTTRVRSGIGEAALLLGGSLNSIARDPGRITYTGMTVRGLIREAYGLTKVYPLSGGLDALSTDRYDVIAKGVS